MTRFQTESRSEVLGGAALDPTLKGARNPRFDVAPCPLRRQGAAPPLERCYDKPALDDTFYQL